MPRFTVHARVLVPVWGHLTVDATNEKEAKKKALEFAACCADEKGIFGSKLWQHGDWDGEVRWEAAHKLKVEDINQEADDEETHKGEFVKCVE